MNDLDLPKKGIPEEVGPKAGARSTSKNLGKREINLAQLGFKGPWVTNRSMFV